jgi:hypothetical protein
LDKRFDRVLIAFVGGLFVMVAAFIGVTVL